MIGLLAAYVQLKIVSIPQNGIGTVVVWKGRSRTRIIEDRFSEPIQDRRFLDLSEEVLFNGVKYKTVEGRLVAKGRRTLEFSMDPAPQYEGLYAPGLRCLGGASLGKTMIWMFAWKNFDVQLDPAVLVTAFEVGFSDGHLKILRKSNVPGMVGYGSCGIFRQNNQLLLTNKSQNLSVFDLDSWKEVACSESTYLSPSGRIYRISDSHLSTSIDGLAWKELRKVDLGYLYAVHSFGKDDVLEFDSSLMLAKSGRTYKFESKKINGQQPQIFVHQKLGVGAVWNTYSTRLETVGIWLDPTFQTQVPILGSKQK